MKKRLRKREFTDEEINEFCHSVEDILGQIKKRGESKKGKKAKSKVKVKEVDVWNGDEELKPIEEELLTF